jgi:hypothetical protein
VIPWSGCAAKAAPESVVTGTWIDSPIAIAIGLSVVLACLGLVGMFAGVRASRARHVFGAVTSLALSGLLLSLTALTATLAVAVQGYRALTREEVAVVVETLPTGAQRFDAELRFPDGRRETLSLAGDQLYVDARILKWKPLANLLGLHTAYELDRVGGRYVDIDDEINKPRTVFSIAEDKPLDLFTLRRRYAVLEPLLDADYGSATFVPANEPGSFEVRVSTTGLLVRPRVGQGS